MKLMQRLGANMSDAELDKCIEIYSSNEGACDEIWIATKYGYPKNETHKEYAEYWVEKAKKFREKGISVSMQISNTLGHGKYMMAQDCSGLVYEGSPARKLVGHDGTVADYCFCWRDEFFRDYLCEHLKYYAKIKPDRIWFDDDYRPVNHAPVSYGCFCESCMARFNEENQTDFTRDELVEEFLHGDKIWREKYIGFVREGMASLMRSMCEAIHCVSPKTHFAYQHGAYGAYIGSNYDHVYDVMHDVSGSAPATRPGGGAYNDHNPNDFLEKLLFVNWQNSLMPDYVKIKAPEIENLPFVAFGKTPEGTAFETSLYMANGNTDMSYSMMMRIIEPWEFYEKFFKLFSEHKPYWNALSEINKISYQSGFRFYYSKDIWKKDLAKEEGMDKLNELPFLAPLDMLRTGIPIAYDKADSSVILLHPECAQTLQNEDIEFLKSKCVITDAESIDILKKKGYDLGIELAEISADDSLVMRERFSEHSAKPKADVYNVSFFIGGRSKAYAMKPDKAEITAYYDPIRKIAPYFSGSDMPYGASEIVIDTDKGGKWAVLGYCPWKNVIPSWMRDHILDLADYISGNALCARLLSPVPVLLSPRKKEDGMTVCVSITNCSIGKTGETQLLVRNPVGEKFYFMSQYNGSTYLTAEKHGNDYIVNIPSIDSWSVATVFMT